MLLNCIVSFEKDLQYRILKITPKTYYASIQPSWFPFYYMLQLFLKGSGFNCVLKCCCNHTPRKAPNSSRNDTQLGNPWPWGGMDVGMDGTLPSPQPKNTVISRGERGPLRAQALGFMGKKQLCISIPFLSQHSPPQIFGVFKQLLMLQHHVLILFPPPPKKTLKGLQKKVACSCCHRDSPLQHRNPKSCKKWKNLRF